MLVTELGLELSSVPQHVLDAAQQLLDVEPGDAPMVRHHLRPLCGAEQDAAEAIAEAALSVHAGGLPALAVAEGVVTAWNGQPLPGHPVECPAGCGRWPCRETLRALDTLGMYQ